MMTAMFVGLPQDDKVMFVNLAAVCYAEWIEKPQQTRLILALPDGFKIEVRDEQADQIAKMLSEVSRKSFEVD